MLFFLFLKPLEENTDLFENQPKNYIDAKNQKADTGNDPIEVFVIIHYRFTQKVHDRQAPRNSVDTYYKYKVRIFL